MYLIADSEEELKRRMFFELENLIENLHVSNKINLIEYTIARDILWDCTFNHDSISIENNIAQDFIDNPDEFVLNLHVGCSNFRKEFPDIDPFNADNINEISADFRDCAY